MHTATRIVLGGLALLFAFTTLYVAAFHAPRPHGIDVGFAGTPAQAAHAQRALDRAAPGAFDVQRYRREPDARAALLDTRVFAVLTGDAILVAGALGAAPTETVTAALERVAPGTPVRDLRPLPAGDRRGLSALFTVVGTLIPSLVFGVLLAVFGRALPARVRWSAVLAYAVGAGLLAAFDAGVLVGALGGSFLGLAAVSALLAAAVGAAAHGLGRLGGPGGIVAAVLLLLLLGVSSAGGAVTYQLEPGFYGAISQYLPPGAALTAVRNVEYFDGAQTLGPVLVLCVWAAGGLAFGLLGERVGPHTKQGRLA